MLRRKANLTVAVVVSSVSGGAGVGYRTGPVVVTGFALRAYVFFIFYFLIISSLPSVIKILARGLRCSLLS